MNEDGAYLIFDQGVRNHVKAVEFYDHIGLVEHGATLEELAGKIGVDAAGLEATVASWNEAVKDQDDQAFGRTTGMDRDISVAPYFAIHIHPAIHYTMGGLHINPETQVLGKDDKVIEGLYAAGEVSGGLHGNNRIGGNSVAETVVFGRQAGIQASKFVRGEN